MADPRTRRVPCARFLGFVGSLALLALAPSTAAAHVVADSTLLPLTPAVLDRFDRALAAEAAERREVARLLSPAARDTWIRCQMRSYQDPEVMKLIQQQSTAVERQDMAALQRVQQAMMAAIETKCGKNPAAMNESRVRERPPTAGAAAGGFDARQYAMLKERVTPFCAVAAPIGSDGVRLPGQGTNVYWVYSPAEAQALRPRCAALQKALAALD
ncbi:MAG TPA: hypothetical protein VEA99_15070 [Gemmatimonadaceae bacterium]|nr:hypothetical protein [Gemmatimonadaceae bacterium]